MIATRRETADGSAGSGDAAALGAADWLCLAAAPTFARMALLTGVVGGGPADMLCPAAQDASPLGGMVPMYLLMSAFHSAPWLKLISSRRSSVLIRHSPDRAAPNLRALHHGSPTAAHEISVASKVIFVFMSLDTGRSLRRPFRSQPATSLPIARVRNRSCRESDERHGETVGVGGAEQLLGIGDRLFAAPCCVANAPALGAAISRRPNPATR